MPFAPSTQLEQVKSALLDPGSYATTLFLICIDNYGLDIMEWEQDVLDREIHDDFNLVLPQINRDKLQAAITALATDMFYVDWFVFNTTCEAFNNDPVDFKVLDIATPEQVAWTITELAMLEGQDKPEFSEEVRAYIGTLLSYFGIHKAPKLLSMASMPKVESNEELLADPIFADSLFTKERSDIEAIEHYVEENVHAMLRQIDSLPFLKRDDESWDKFISKLSDR